MSWNYRLFRHENKYAGKVTYWYALHEVFYNDEGKPFTYAVEPDAVGESIDDLISSLNLMLKDAKVCKKGEHKGKKVKILKEKDFQEGGAYYTFMVEEEKSWKVEMTEPLPKTTNADRRNKASSPTKSKGKSKKRL